MIYAAFGVLVLTGIGWFIADHRKDTENAELWQQVAATLLMLHGGGAMLTLLLLGALVPLHVQRAWRGGKNRATGTTMVALNILLVVTAFGLYYAGSDVVRPWISDLHIVVGTILPALFIIHVLLGRRSTRRGSISGRGLRRREGDDAKIANMCNLQTVLARSPRHFLRRSKAEFPIRYILSRGSTHTREN
jgi:hypothetical protein